MGQDKALLPFGGYPTLTQYQVERFKPFFEHIYVSCKNREKFDFAADFIEDLKIYEDSAPLIGLVSVFEQLRAEYIFVLSVDTPFFSYEYFLCLYENIDEKSDVILAEDREKTHPLCALYSRKSLPLLKENCISKNYKLHNVFENLKVKYVSFESEKILTNLNYHEEYQNALKER